VTWPARFLPKDAVVRLLAGGASRAVLVRPIGTALALVAHIALARMMGPAEYGAFVYVYFWTYFLGLLARLGLDRSAVRFGTAFLAEKNFAALRTLIEHSFRVALGLGVLAGAAMALFGALWPWDLGAAQTDCFLAGALLVPLLSAHNVYEGIAQAQKRIWQATIPEQVLRQGLMGLMGAAVYGMRGELSAVHALLAYGAAMALTLLTDWAWYRKSRPAELSGAPSVPVRREWLAYAGQMSAITLVGTWILQADLVVVGAMLGPESASLYSVATRIASLVAWVGVAAGLVFAPIVVELGVGQPNARLQRYSTLVAWAMAFAAVSLASFLWVFRGPILGLFGPAFIAAAAPLGILLMGNVLREAFGPAFTLLNFSGLHQTALSIMAVTGVLNFIANVVLTDAIGMEGAAAATALTVIGYSAAFWHVLRRRLGIDSAAVRVGLARPPRM
jgi:O-antigen/teichoic acid export membrane protein